MNLPLKNTQITERERIMSHLLNCYVVDVGFIKSIESDKKFVEVTHANILQVYDELSNTYKLQNETVTKHVEVLYLGSSYYQEIFDLAVGDVGLLLGTVAYVEKMRDVTVAKQSEHISNYQQENLKFLPIANNQTPKIKKYIDSQNTKETETFDSAWGNIVITKGITGVKIVVNNNLTFFMDYATNKFQIKNTTYSLKDLLDEYITDLTSAQTGSGGSPAHTHTSVGVSDVVILNLLKNKIDALLES
jgi:hypothetical protein